MKVRYQAVRNCGLGHANQAHRDKLRCVGWLLCWRYISHCTPVTHPPATKVVPPSKNPNACSTCMQRRKSTQLIVTVEFTSSLHCTSVHRCTASMHLVPKLP
jgi:hypothetical protein